VTRTRRLQALQHSCIKELHGLKWCILFYFMDFILQKLTRLNMIFQSYHVYPITTIQNLVEAEIQFIEEEFISKLKENINTNACD
jgi:hypothetical protein